MNDFATSEGDDAFTPEEQAAFDAYASGQDAPQEAAGSAEGPSGADAAPEAAAPAPEAAAAPGEVVDPDAEADGSAEENKGKFVRHGAFHQERERRKALEREVTELREKHARGDERLRLLTEAAQRSAAPAAAPAASAEPEKAPDPDDDIFGYARYLEKQIADIRTGQTQLTEAQKHAQESRAAETQRNETLNTYRADVQRVMAAEPAFAEAYNHLFAGRVAEMKLFGMSDTDALKAAHDDEFALVQSAIQGGRSPAEIVLQMAKARGFAPKAAEPAPEAQPAAPTETPAERATRIEAGQRIGKSLSSAGGAPAGELTFEMLASMSEAEFEKAMKSNPARVRKLMGAES